MKELALRYYCEGYGCGQSIIKAADTKYSLGLGKDMIRAISAAQNGFGYGGLCAAAAAPIFIFYVMFDEDTAKRLRLEFLESFKMNFRSFNCCAISGDCETIISCAAEIADKLIEGELKA